MPGPPVIIEILLSKKLLKAFFCSLLYLKFEIFNVSPTYDSTLSITASKSNSEFGISLLERLFNVFAMKTSSL